MEAREMEPKDLMVVLNIPEKLALSIITGEQQIDRSQALELGNYFNVSPINFCDNSLLSESQSL